MVGQTFWPARDRRQRLPQPVHTGEPAIIALSRGLPTCIRLGATERREGEGEKELCGSPMANMEMRHNSDGV